jgi:hypothetical protein
MLIMRNQLEWEKFGKFLFFKVLVNLNKGRIRAARANKIQVLSVFYLFYDQNNTT